MRFVGLPVAVIGAGSFGTCLALLCGRENDVRLWSRSADVAEAINREHRNPRYLRETVLPPSVRATVVPGGGAGAAARWSICAVPSHGVRDVMAQAAPYLVAGLDPGLRREGPRVRDRHDDAPGARGRAAGRPPPAHRVPLRAPRSPTRSPASSRRWSPSPAARRPTRSPCRPRSRARGSAATPTRDVIGVEIGGALKNVIAIAVGHRRRHAAGPQLARRADDPGPRGDHPPRPATGGRTLHLPRAWRAWATCC